jgi:hypothetical protein
MRYLCKYGFLFASATNANEIYNTAKTSFKMEKAG